jgi:hypothetical protein
VGAAECRCRELGAWVLHHQSPPVREGSPVAWFRSCEVRVCSEHLAVAATCLPSPSSFVAVHILFQACWLHKVHWQAACASVCGANMMLLIPTTAEVYAAARCCSVVCKLQRAYLGRSQLFYYASMPAVSCTWVPYMGVPRPLATLGEPRMAAGVVLMACLSLLASLLAGAAVGRGLAHGLCWRALISWQGPRLCWSVFGRGLQSMQACAERVGGRNVATKLARVHGWGAPPCCTTLRAVSAF